MVKVLTGTYEGCQGVVADVDESVLNRPKVRVLFDPDGSRIEAVGVELNDEDEVTFESIRGEVPTYRTSGELEVRGRCTCIAAARKHCAGDRGETGRKEMRIVRTHIKGQVLPGVWRSTE